MFQSLSFMLTCISTTAVIHISAFIYGNVHTLGKVGHQLASPQAVFSVCTRAVHTRLNEVCLQTITFASLWSISALFPIFFYDACSTSTCNAKSLFFSLLWTSFSLLLLQPALKKPSLPLWLHTKALGG